MAISGVCLTVVDHDGDQARFDVIDETLDKTTLGSLVTEAEVNFERAAAFGDEIGGHLISGHVSGTLEVVSRTPHGENLELVFRAPPDQVRYLLPKGYVSIDGISLTIGRVDDDTFSVHLIPETRRVTTIDAKQPGSTANLEVDPMTQAVVATVERLLAERHA